MARNVRLRELLVGIEGLAPGGRLIVSVLHPFQAILGWHAPFEDDNGQRWFVREHPHTHADYLHAFAAAGLGIRRCLEPKLTAAEVPAKRRAFRHLAEAAGTRTVRRRAP